MLNGVKHRTPVVLNGVKRRTPVMLNGVKHPARTSC